LSYAVDRARATRVTVRVRPDGRRLVAEVSDDGARPDGASGAVPDGLAGLTGRVRALRGHVEFDGDPTRGTTVRMVLPCE
jgi:signal transduction histidine kinase